MNKNIKKKVTPKGKTRYTFSIYIGRDPRTGSPKQVRRSYESYETAEKARTNKRHGQQRDGAVRRIKHREYQADTDHGRHAST